MNDKPEKPESQKADADALVKLAVARFGKLTSAEDKLFRKTAVGEVADYSSSNKDENDPAGAEDWGEDRVLQADRIAWLCADTGAQEYITHGGLRIQGARIEGVLDLEAIRFPYCCGLQRCRIAGGVILRDAEFLGLNLTGSHTTTLSADRIKVEGGVFLRNGFQAEGEVRLAGATIGGGLDCDNGTFINSATSDYPDGCALNAEGMKVEGAVFLGNGFKAKGEVRLLGATIGQSIESTDGTFMNPSGYALNANRVKVEGSVFLRGVQGQGEVCLLGAAIGGNLDCANGTFINPNGYALSADRMKVEGNVFLINGFEAKGEVRLLGATIGGSLGCIGGTFINPNGDALGAEGMKVEGAVFLRDGFKAVGNLSFVATTIQRHFQLRGVADDSDFELNLKWAHIGVLCDEPSSWPAPGKLHLHGLVYDDIAKGAPSDAKTRIEWLELQDDKEYFPQPYEQLATVLRKNGQIVDAREVLIAKEKFRKDKGTLALSEWPWYYFFGPMIGYGYNPMLALRPALIIIVLGALLFWCGEDLLAPTGGEPYSMKSEIRSTPYPTFNALVYSLDTFIPIVDFHQVNYRLPNAQLGPDAVGRHWYAQPGFWLLMWFWFEVVAGWLITSVLVYGVARFVRS